MFLCTTMNTLKNKTLTALFITAFAATGLLSACHSGEKKEAAAEADQSGPVITPVGTAPVERGHLTSTIGIPGELTPYQTVDLYAKVTSFVKKIYVDIGSEVHTGQLLVTLEAPEVNSQLAASKSRVEQFKAVYFASKATYDRLESTSKTPGTVSQNDLEVADAKAKSDLANVEAAKSDYQAQAANLAYLEIRAPFDGVITARNINPGAYVGPAGKGSDMPLFVLQEQKHLRLVISVPEAYTGGLNNNDHVTFSVKALPSEKFTAQVKRLAGALDERLRSERLEMDVANPNKRLLPGMYAEVDLHKTSKDSTLIVPKGAVITSTEKVFVIKIVDHKAVWVDVQKGLSSVDKTEIFGDIKPGDQLVIGGTDEIRDGQPVKDTAYVAPVAKKP